MVDGLDIFSHSTKDLALVAGMVFQSADNQLLMNTVEAELAFGLENLALLSKRLKPALLKHSIRFISIIFVIEKSAPFRKEKNKKWQSGQCWLCPCLNSQRTHIGIGSCCSNRFARSYKTIKC